MGNVAASAPVLPPGPPARQLPYLAITWPALHPVAFSTGLAAASPCCDCGASTSWHVLFHWSGPYKGTYLQALLLIRPPPPTLLCAWGSVSSHLLLVGRMLQGCILLVLAPPTPSPCGYCVLGAPRCPPAPGRTLQACPMLTAHVVTVCLLPSHWPHAPGRTLQGKYNIVYLLVAQRPPPPPSRSGAQGLCF